MKRILTSIALAASVLFTGCGEGLPSEAQVNGIVHQLQHAPELVRHSGVRRVESYYTLHGVVQPEVYREEVFADGAGGFYIQPLQMVQGGLDDVGAFQALHLARMGFHWRYRDFLVRDLTAFLNNYELTSYGQAVTIADRPCQQVRVARKDGSASYEVALDVQTGLVLRYRELDANGVLFAAMEYESYDPFPDLTGVPLQQPGQSETPLTDLDVLDFEPVTPKLIADGAYSFLEATLLDHPVTGDDVVKLTFTDGVETIFFLDFGPVLEEASEATGPALPSYPSTSVAGFDKQGGLDQDIDVIRRFQDGPLSILWGELAGHSIVALGKTPYTGLLMMLESALAE